MSTHCVIGQPAGDGFAGRFCWNDGHPDEMIPGLRELYATVFWRHMGSMLDGLLRQPYGWSWVGPGYGSLPLPARDGRFKRVRELGIAYTAKQWAASGADWINADGTAEWITTFTDEELDFAYLLDADALAVWQQTRGAWEPIGRVRWADPLDPLAVQVGQ